MWIKIGNNMGIIGNRNLIFLSPNHRVLRPEPRGKNYQKWTILGPLRPISISKVLSSLASDKIQNMIFQGLSKSNQEVLRLNFFLKLHHRGLFNDPIYKARPFSTSKVPVDPILSCRNFHPPSCSFGITEARASKG